MTTYNITRYFDGYIIKDIPADNKEEALDEFLSITEDFMQQLDSTPDVKVSWNQADIVELN